MLKYDVDLAQIYQNRKKKCKHTLKPHSRNTKPGEKQERVSVEIMQSQQT